MTLRRLLVAGAAVAVAATGGAVAGPAAPARAATPTHVGIVVAGVGSYCVPYRAGMTGADVLDAHFQVVYGQRSPYVGFVFTIDGVGTTSPDNTHYWAYFHGSGGGWAYSDSGAAGYQPQPGTVEGWSYQNGSTSPVPPPAVSYAGLCGSLDPAAAPRPATSPSSPAPAHRSTTSAAPAPAPATAAPGPLPASADTTAQAPARRPSGRRPAASHRPARTTATATAAAPTTTVSPTATDVRLSASPTAKDTARSSGSAAATSAAALLAVVALGAGAFWRMRRQRQS